MPVAPEQADLTEMLDRQAQALLAGDEQAYLAVLDEGNRELIQQQRMVFENLRQLPVGSIGYIVPSPWAEFEPAPPPPKVGESDKRAEWVPSGPWWFVPVVRAVTLATDDPGSGLLGPGETYEYTVARRGAGWMISDVTPLNRAELDERRFGGTYDIGRRVAAEAPPAHAPWLLTQLHVVQAGNVWLAADDTVSAGDLANYADVAEEEASEVEQIWGNRPTFPGHIFFLTRDEAALGRWFDLGEEHVGQFAGVAVPQQAVKQTGVGWGTNEYVGGRMVVNLSRSEEHSKSPRSVMRHELTHTVTSRAWEVGPYTFPSRWAVEGFARYIEARGETERERNEQYWAAQGFDGQLSGSRTFYDGDSQVVATNYARAYTVFRFAEQLSSLEAAVEFYARLVQHPAVAVDLLTDTGSLTEEGKTGLDEIWLDTIGVGVDSFVSQWRSFVQQGG